MDTTYARYISSVHIIPYRERRLSSNTANTAALILAFLLSGGPSRPKAGTTLCGEKDFGRTFTEVYAHTSVACFSNDNGGESAEWERKSETVQSGIPDRPRGDYASIIGDPVGNLASMAPLFVRQEEKERSVQTSGRAGNAIETDNRSRFIRSENLSFAASVLRMRVGIIARNVIETTPDSPYPSFLPS